MSVSVKSVYLRVPSSSNVSPTPSSSKRVVDGKEELDVSNEDPIQLKNYAAFLQDKFDGDKLVEGNKTIEYSIVSMIKDLNLNLLLCNLQIHINFLFLP